MEYAIPGAAVGIFFRSSQFIYTFFKFCANNFTIPVQTGAYNIKIKAACRRVSKAQYKSYTILTPGLSSAALAKEEARKLHKWSVEERLHKRPQGATSSTFAQGYGGQASKASQVFGENVKKKLCFLSEVVPDGTVK